MASEREKELAWLQRRLDDLGREATRFQSTAARLGLREVSEHLNTAIASIEAAFNFCHDVEISAPKKPGTS